MILDPHQQGWFQSKGFEVDYMLDDGIDMINAIIAGHDAEDVTFALHVCRGNDANRYMARGGYDMIARKVFQRCDVSLLLLEYDDDRSGSFEPLSEVPEDTSVVLGLISTKRAEMEREDELIARINEAARYIPLERLALSPQCGFASVASGNHLGFEKQSAKLKVDRRRGPTSLGQIGDISQHASHREDIPIAMLHAGNGVTILLLLRHEYSILARRSIRCAG